MGGVVVSVCLQLAKSSILRVRQILTSPFILSHTVAISYTAHTTSHIFLCLVKDPPPAEVKLLTPGVAEAGRAATSVTLIPYLVVLPNVVLLLASGKRDHLLNYTFDLQGFWAACVPDSTKYLAFISKYCGNEKH